LKPDQVARIESWTHTRRLQHTNRPDPQSALDAKFSVQHCLALALVDRTIKIEHFEGDAWRDPKVRALLPRVQAATYTTAQFPEHNHFGAEVRVTTTDGKTVSGKIDEALGRGAVSPLPVARLHEKFLNCAARALPAATCAALLEAIERLEQRADLRTLGALLTPPAPPARERLNQARASA
ncbi:MAG: MmgE/PrpD family protein, partial [Alphaproteobacteria bacterium]|nr:MmgE/PrpD family protein [Alphaproteobacteria bacterium]